MTHLTKVQRAYDRWAQIYDHEDNPLQLLEGPAVRTSLGDVKGLLALDLGCGTGRHSLWLAINGAQVTAIDFSSGMLEQARSKSGAESIQFIQHDLHRPLPFESNSFDLVVSGLVIEHLESLDPFFAEARRVLKPNGRAVFSTLHPAMFLRGTQARFTDPVSGELVQPGSIAHSVGDIIMSASRAGLTIDQIVESAPDVELARRSPRSEKYVGWPMLLMVSFRLPTS